MPHILIIDDVAENIMLLSAVLKKVTQYTVTSVSNGYEALDWLTITPELPDIILCDEYMPGLTGHELCQQVLQNPTWSHIPFILMSAGGAEMDLEAFGATAFLPKPFPMRDLLATVDRYL